MPLANGYGYDVVRKNIREMLASGHPSNQATAAAKALARRCYFRRFPHGYLPRFLQYPIGRGNRADYNERGESLRIAQNPASLRKISAAKKLYTAFSGHPAEVFARIPAPKVPDVMLAIGKIRAVEYEAIRAGEKAIYRHSFAQHARPLLAASHDGRTVMLLGGAYTFTDRGIVDKKRR